MNKLFETIEDFLNQLKLDFLPDSQFLGDLISDCIAYIDFIISLEERKLEILNFKEEDFTEKKKPVYLLKYPEAAVMLSVTKREKSLCEKHLVSLRTTRDSYNLVLAQVGSYPYPNRNIVLDFQETANLLREEKIQLEKELNQ